MDVVLFVVYQNTGRGSVHSGHSSKRRFTEDYLSLLIQEGECMRSMDAVESKVKHHSVFLIQCLFLCCGLLSFILAVLHHPPTHSLHVAVFSYASPLNSLSGGISLDYQVKNEAVSSCCNHSNHWDI